MIMAMLGYFLGALATVLNIVLTLYMWIIIARAVLSWVSPDPYNPIVRFIYSITEPVLSQIRRRLPVSFSGIDFSRHHLFAEFCGELSGPFGTAFAVTNGPTGGGQRRSI
jgi:YggT family protein